MLERLKRLERTYLLQLAINSGQIEQEKLQEAVECLGALLQEIADDQ